MLKRYAAEAGVIHREEKLMYSSSDRVIFHTLSTILNTCT